MFRLNINEPRSLYDEQLDANLFEDDRRVLVAH
jgi:hypothetical protein